MIAAWAIGGIVALYDAATLDEIWPRQRKLPTTQWWMAAERQ